VPCEVEEEDVALAGGAGAGWLCAGGLGTGLGAAVLLLAAVAGAPLTVTSGEIFAMIPAETPAFDKSSTDEYGRPAIIFFAVAGPTPGKLSNSFSFAVFKSTLLLVVSELVELVVDSFEVLAFLSVCPAKMVDVKTPHASNMVNDRK